MRAPIDNQQVAQQCSDSAAGPAAGAAKSVRTPARWPSLHAAKLGLSEAEIDAASEEWGCNCGPAALAAILALKPADVRHHIPEFEKRGYTNPSMMERALRSLGVGFTNLDDASDRVDGVLALPSYGLVRVQWTGPWMRRTDRYGVMEQYRHTHWIATATFSDGSRGNPARKGSPNYIFDVNFGWHHRTWWEEDGGPRLAAAVAPKGDGKFTFTHRWEIALP